MSSVYIIECAGYVKIGLAKNPQARVKELNTGAPVRAELFRSRAFETRQSASEIERRLHRIFAHKRTNGEWFDVTPQDAWEALKRQRPLRLINAAARHDSTRRFASTEPYDITDILAGRITVEQVRDRDAQRTPPAEV